MIPLGNMMIGALVATGTKTPQNLTPEQLEKTIDFLIEVKKQSRVVAASWGDLADAMARGDVAVTFNGWETMVKFCGDKGKMVKYIYPEGAAPTPGSTTIASPRMRPTSTRPMRFANRVIECRRQKRLAENAIQAIVNSTRSRLSIPAIRASTPMTPSPISARRRASSPSRRPSQNDQFTTFSDWLKAYERFKTA